MNGFVRSSLLLVVGVALLAGFSDQVSAQSCGCTDIALVIDDTGSMGPAIASVKSGLTSIIGMAQQVSGDDLQMSVVSFPSDAPVVRQAMTDVLANVVTAVNNLFAGGGGNVPEASDEALRLVVSGSSNCSTADPGDFREECLKIAILVTDALPGGCNDNFQAGVDDVAAAQVASLAATAGIKVSAVYVPTDGVDPTTAAIMQTYATTTGGQFSQVGADGSGTADAIMQIIEACGGAGVQSRTAPALSWGLLGALGMVLAGWGTWRVRRSYR
jgi:Mg-chelatase subunit ChlD